MELFIFLILFMLSGFFSGVETAFFSIHQSQIRIMEQKKMKNASLIMKLKSKPQRLLITILIGNNVVNLFTASYATVVAISFFGSAGLGIATGVTTFFILIFGEIMPKSVAYANNMRIARLTAKPLYVLFIILYPVSYVLLMLNRATNKIFKSPISHGVSEEEIRVMSRMGVESGAIDYREHEMIENIFKFDDVLVGEIMTPISRTEMLNGSVPVEQIAHFVSHSGFSRYPVYDGNENNIIGYIHVNQIMLALNSDDRDQPVSKFISPITLVDEDMEIERVFRSMKKDKVHMYAVHSDKNRKNIVGVITLEDILEQIVGEIEDETDKV